MPRLSIFEGNIKMSWLAFGLHLSRHHIPCDGRHLTSLLVHFVETAEFPLNYLPTKRYYLRRGLFSVNGSK